MTTLFEEVGQISQMGEVNIHKLQPIKASCESPHSEGKQPSLA